MGARGRQRLSMRPALGALWSAAAVGLLFAPCASQEEDSVTIYFGSGCFWHVQHEFVVVEQDLLGRDGGGITAVSGYAGGRTASAVCYGNYGNLGHTEVVQVDVPRRHLQAFAEQFWRLFLGKDRVDIMDVGADYRAALGLPGGMRSPLLNLINASQFGQVAQWFALEAGAGSDRDTLGEALVWVYDSDEFPFYPAEAWHQFHDDFMAGGNYPVAYNSLLAKALDCCRLAPTGCPTDVTWSGRPDCRGGLDPDCLIADGDSDAAPSGSAGDGDLDTNYRDFGGSGGGSGGGSFNEGTTSAAPAGSSAGTTPAPVTSTSTAGVSGLCLTAGVAVLCAGLSAGHP